MREILISNMNKKEIHMKQFEILDNVLLIDELFLYIIIEFTYNIMYFIFIACNCEKLSLDYT